MPGGTQVTKYGGSSGSGGGGGSASGGGAMGGWGGDGIALAAGQSYSAGALMSLFGDLVGDPPGCGI